MIGLEDTAGHGEVLAVERWSAPASAGEQALLLAARTPVLDVGCGPGRLVAYLAEQGRCALGIDAAPAAVARTLARGAAALARSVFAPLPGERRWGTVILLDGNVGIGGDPVRLLARCRQLLAPGGRVLVEVGRAGTPTRCEPVRLVGDVHSAWFPWAWVGADGVAEIAAASGLRVLGLEPVEGRWFAWLDAPPPPPPPAR